MRVLKDRVVNKTKAYTPAQLLDFITSECRMNIMNIN